MNVLLSLFLSCSLIGGLLPAHSVALKDDSLTSHGGRGIGDLRRLENALSLSDQEVDERLGRFLWWEQWKKRPQIGADISFGIPGKKRAIRHHTARRVVVRREAIPAARQPKLVLDLDRFTFDNMPELSVASSEGVEDSWVDALGEPPPAPTALPLQISGRLAISSDGNNHDCDDITATAMSVALLAKTGNASKLVYYGHSDHHWSSNTVESCGSVTDREAEMHISSHGTAELWGGFNLSAFHNASADTAGAIAALVTQINASSAGNPLTIIAAGPMDIVGQALNTAGANKDYVTVISHSTWNDNHSDTPEGEPSHSGWTWAEMQAANGTVTFTHINDQNTLLTVAESNYFWLRDSSDSRLTWIWDRHIVGAEGPTDGHFDPSDAGMLYYLLTGDQGATPRKIRFILEPIIYPGTTWDTATPAEMGFNPGEFAAALAALPSKSIVIRNGYVVGTKGNVATTGLVWSASKSLVSLIFARQLQLGNVGYDSTIPGSDVPGSPLATYRQFLSNTSDFHLTPHAPGDHFAYNNGAWHHVGTHLKTTFYPGRTHVQTLQDAFVTALGFQNTLGYNTAGFMSGWDGGWSMSTQDLARIGHLVLRDGDWKGQQLLSASHIADLYTNQIPGAATLSTDTADLFYNECPPTCGEMAGSHSYGFWLPLTFPSDGSTTNTEAIRMSGAFGTTVFISRLHNIVAVNVNSGGTTTNPSDRISGDEFDAIINALESTPAPQTSATYYVRNGGGTTGQCTGLANVDYDGSGSGEPCAFSNPQNAYNAATFGDTIKLAAGQTFRTQVDYEFGEWVLPNKGTPPTGTDADYITITTTDPSGTPAALSGYPATRTRITDAMAVNMPHVVGEGSTPLFRIAQGAKYWNIERLDITNDGSNGWQTIVFIDTDTITSLANVPDHIKIQYNWIHPDEETGVAMSAGNMARSAENAVYMTATNLTVQNNAMQGFAGRFRYGGSQGQPMTSSNILIATYAQNLLIQNNLLEAWTYSFFTGGSFMPDWTVTNGGTVVSCSSPTVCTLSNTSSLAVGDPISIHIASIPTWSAGFVSAINGNTVTLRNAPCLVDPNVNCAPIPGNPTPANGDKVRWDGLQPSNVLIKRNIFAHYPEWAALLDGDCGGKGYLEVKACVDCTLIGNVFTECSGPTITVRNQGADFVWASLDRLRLESNYWEDSNRPFVSYLRDTIPTKKSRDVTFHNNLILGLTGNTNFYQGGQLSSNTGGGINLTFTHNTVAWNKTHAGTSLSGWHNFVGFLNSVQEPGGNALDGFVFRDNIIPMGINFCFDIDAGGETTVPMPQCWPGADIRKNAFVNADNYLVSDINSWWTTHWPNNTITTGYGPVGFTAPTSTLGAGGDYRLLPTSQFKNAASDGTDVGYNHTLLVNALGFDPYGGAPPVTFTVCKWSTTPLCQ